jgi:hypothetical protein
MEASVFDAKQRQSSLKALNPKAIPREKTAWREEEA